MVTSIRERECDIPSWPTTTCSAWGNQYTRIIRETVSGLRHVAVGYDSKGREIEMDGVELEDGDAMTAPSMKTYHELGMGRR